MKNLLKQFALATFVFTCLSVFTCAKDKADTLPSPTTPPKLVNDFGHVMKPEDISTLEAELEKFDTDHGIQIAVVTLPSLGEYASIEDLANDLFRKWGIGHKNASTKQGDKDTGVLLVFCVAEKKRRIEVGYGMEGDLTDGKSGEILRTFRPYVENAERGDQGAYSAGLVSVAQSLEQHFIEKKLRKP